MPVDFPLDLIVYCILFSLSFVYQFVDLFYKRYERASVWFVVSAFSFIGMSSWLYWFKVANLMGGAGQNLLKP